jgi:hypothetical protein
MEQREQAEQDEADEQQAQAALQERMRALFPFVDAAQQQLVLVDAGGAPVGIPTMDELELQLANIIAEGENNPAYVPDNPMELVVIKGEFLVPRGLIQFLVDLPEEQQQPLCVADGDPDPMPKSKAAPKARAKAKAKAKPKAKGIMGNAFVGPMFPGIVYRGPGPTRRIQQFSLPEMYATLNIRSNTEHAEHLLHWFSLYARAELAASRSVSLPGFGTFRAHRAHEENVIVFSESPSTRAAVFG